MSDAANGNGWAAPGAAPTNQSTLNVASTTTGVQGAAVPFQNQQGYAESFQAQQQQPQPGFPSVYPQTQFTPQQQFPAQGATTPGIESEIFPCPKRRMGIVIGQKGVTIKDVQRRSGCDIQINQDVPPGQDCLITIRGSRQAIDTAKTMLTQIVEMGPDHPYQGAHGSRFQQQGDSRGGPPGNGYGGQQQYYQQYQSQQAAAAYGSYGQAPQGYQQFQAQPYAQQAYPTSQYGAQPPPSQGGSGPSTSVWKTATASDGQVYYYNTETGATQWDKPPEV